VAVAFTDDPPWFRTLLALAGQPTVERAPDYTGETAT
jgi:hypothetical protein